MKKSMFKKPLLLVALLALCVVFPVLAACDNTNPVTKYDVAFESNGGTMYYGVRAEAGDYIALPWPEREGYEFLGWYDNAEGAGEAIVGNYTVAQSTTLYAKWDEAFHVISFNANGGSACASLNWAAGKINLPTTTKMNYISSLRKASCSA